MLIGGAAVLALAASTAVTTSALAGGEDGEKHLVVRVFPDADADGVDFTRSPFQQQQEGVAGAVVKLTYGESAIEKTAGKQGYASFKQDELLVCAQEDDVECEKSALPDDLAIEVVLPDENAFRGAELNDTRNPKKLFYSVPGPIDLEEDNFQPRNNGRDEAWVRFATVPTVVGGFTAEGETATVTNEEIGSSSTVEVLECPALQDGTVIPYQLGTEDGTATGDVAYFDFTIPSEFEEIAGDCKFEQEWRVETNQVLQPFADKDGVGKEDFSEATEVLACGPDEPIKFEDSTSVDREQVLCFTDIGFDTAAELQSDIGEQSYVVQFFYDPRGFMR